MANSGQYLVQWLNRNMTSAFPFADYGTEHNNGIPQSLLIDASFSVPAQFLSSSDACLYVSRFSVVPQRIQLTIGMFYSGVDYPQVLFCRDIPKTVKPAILQQDVYKNTYGLSVSSVQNLPDWVTDIAGEITIGATYGMQFQMQASVFSYADNTTHIHKHCIHRGSSGVSALIVGDKRLTGDVRICAGEGISVSVQDNEIHINVDSQAIDIDKLVQQIQDALGNPVLTINGQAPDASGNFDITGLDCTQISGFTGGITISNPCSRPCCGQTTNSELSAAVAVLEETKNTMNDHYVSLTATVNAMTSRLAILISNLK